jgi:SAM-dependent methyltransferase
MTPIARDQPVGSLPMPPVAMRELVGPTEESAFDNPVGQLVYDFIPVEAYESVFDFGCGCGRVARQLIQQAPQPMRYVGIDLHRGMAEWAQHNLAPACDGFSFVHHDVFDVRFNPTGCEPPVRRFPVEDKSFTLVHAHSVFTHLTQMQTEYYLSEIARIVTEDGYLYTTWFLFDKTCFPMLPESHAALYVDHIHPGAAVIFDRSWLLQQLALNDLRVGFIIPPRIRGYQWVLVMRPVATGVTDAEWPLDDAPIGKAIPPRGSVSAHLVR